MKCNIDRRGRWVRGGPGVLCLILAFVAPVGVAGRVLLALGGLFGLFEAFVGWCAIRALGVKTWL